MMLTISASLVSCDDVTGSQDNPVVPTPTPTPTPAPTYASDLERPLTFEAAVDGVKVTLKFASGATPDYKKVEYSLDQGATWTALKSPNQAIILEKAGDMVMFRGDNPTYNGDAQFVTELVNANARTRTWKELGMGGMYAFLFGNVMSLIQNKDFANLKKLVKNNQAAFKNLFKNARIDAQNANGTKKLVLPAIGQEVVIDAFKGMFEGSTIQNAPKVVAEVLGYGTIADMFKDCEDLKNVFLSLGYLAEGTTPGQAMGGVLGGTTGKNTGGTSDPNAGRGSNVIWAPLPPRLDEEGRSIFNGDNRPLSLDDVMNASGIAEDVLENTTISLVNPQTGITSDPKPYIAVKSITIRRRYLYDKIYVGDDFDMSVIINPSNATDQSYTWIMEDEKGNSSSILSCRYYDEVYSSEDIYDRFTALAPGIAYIYAVQGNKSSERLKICVGIAVTGVSLSQKTLSLKVGSSATLTATVAPTDATDQAVTWSSDKESVATIFAGTDGKATIYAEGAGEATITVTTNDGSKTATCVVTVTDTDPDIAVTGVTLDQETLILDTGGTATLTATIAPGDATDQAVTWSSDKESVATVDKDGKITAVAAGEATITVKTNDGGFTATCKVTVLDANSATIDVTMGEEDL